MSFQNGIKFRSLVEFWEYLPEEERIITDVLRQIILENMPSYCKEKLTYNVPFFYGKRRICLIWPSSVPRSGVKSGVLMGFCQGNKLKDESQYLTHGSNKQVYYRIYHAPGEIDSEAIISLLREAVELDNKFR
ncbi:MAG TPA: DUF1801 domain-containing protein [Chitinophagaceae bacterium]|nr:DUF1801 domain-containing protein [Chitinophagaceae bacterium]